MKRSQAEGGREESGGPFCGGGGGERGRRFVPKAQGESRILIGNSHKQTGSAGAGDVALSSWRPQFEEPPEAAQMGLISGPLVVVFVVVVWIVVVVVVVWVLLERFVLLELF